MDKPNKKESKKNNKIIKKENKNVKTKTNTNKNINKKVSRKISKSIKKEKNKKNMEDMKNPDSLEEKLKYIGLDPYNLPDFILNETKPLFKLNSLAKDKEENVFLYLNIKDLSFLITTKNSDDELIEKYKASKEIKEFLKMNSKDEEDNKNSFNFLKIIENLDVSEINRIEKIQSLMKDNIPDTIKYFKSNMWNIYYSFEEKRYFMIVSLEDLEHSEFLFALKQKIMCQKENKDYYIYAPINYLDKSESFISKTQREEIENILWYFTRNWPVSYETYDKDSNYALNFVGLINVYDELSPRYLKKIEEKEEALKLYKFLKAIYTLEHETRGEISFKCALSDTGSICFKYKYKGNYLKIKYEDLPLILEKAYEKIYEKYNWYKEKIEERIVFSYNLKNKMEEKEEEYKILQNEIVKYLNIKDTFFGRFKYFFRKKMSKRILDFNKKEDNKDKNKKENENIQKDISKNNIKISKKDQKQIDQEIKNIFKDLKLEKIKSPESIYNITVEDVVNTYNIYINLYEKTKELINDINAAKLFLINIDKKIANAEKYLEEIEFSKRSIFAFWKFTNKDNIKKLSSADEIKMPHEKSESERLKQEQIQKEERIFNFNMEFLKFAEDVDDMQRETLNFNDLTAIFLSKYFLKEIKLVLLLDELENNKNKEKNKDKNKDNKNKEEENNKANEDKNIQNEKENIENIENKQIEKIKKELNKSLEKMKKEYEKSKKFLGISYDIFGQAEKTSSVKYMKDKAYREKNRNIFEAFRFNLEMDLDEYINRIRKIEKDLEKSINKIKLDQKLSVYLLEEIDEEENKNEEKDNKDIFSNKYGIFNLSVENEFNKYKGNSKKLKLIKLNLKSGTNLSYYSNIVFYTNQNKTLPLGMEDSFSLIINLDKIKNKVKLKNKKSMYINKYFDKPTNIEKEIPYKKENEIVMENNIKKIYIEEYFIY